MMGNVINDNVRGYGEVRVKVLRVLADASPGTLSARSICIYTGIAYRVIAVSLLKWVKLGLIDRELMPCLFRDADEPEYKITAAGNTWLASRMLEYASYLAALDAWQEAFDIDSLDYWLKLNHTEFDKSFPQAITQTVY